MQNLLIIGFNSTTSYSPFELAYGFNPLSLLDFFPLHVLPNYANDEEPSSSKSFMIRQGPAKLIAHRKEAQPRASPT
ncbi:hypothetical protein CR513_55859, partial [Mucuna pruriens]